jgi:hypothetical protein
MTQQSTDVTLEPRPWCGTYDVEIGKFSVYCTQCHCEGPSASDKDETQEKIDFWNTRATLSKPVGDDELSFAVQFVSSAMKRWKLDNREGQNLEILLRHAQLAQPPEGYVLVPIKDLKPEWWTHEAEGYSCWSDIVTEFDPLTIGEVEGCRYTGTKYGVNFPAWNYDWLENFDEAQIFDTKDEAQKAIENFKAMIAAAPETKNGETK